MASPWDDVIFEDDSYKYQPLDATKYQIRLIKRCNPLEPTMDYCLTTFDFENAPSYAALSYMWGEESPTGYISIDGKKLEIRTNLLNFLATYKEEQYLWIDQICVDQSNLKERSHQVRMMYQIYSQCSFVLVWLRDESTYAPSTQQAALDFNNGIQKYAQDGHRENGSTNDERFLKWPALALLHNSYFDRLWVVQELLLAKKIHILVEGKVWVSWESLLSQDEELRKEVRKRLWITSWMIDRQNLRSRYAEHKHLEASYYITFTVGNLCRKKCKDPRDKVYGLMAMIQPSSQVDIDYTKSTHQVFLDAVMSMIKEYWYMRHYSPDDGQFDRIYWVLEESFNASWSLARNMGFTTLEKYGLSSFLECIWQSLVQYEFPYKKPGCKMDAETPCITSVGFEQRMRQLSGKERHAATCDRWWYELDGSRYYHDCKEWSGKAKSREYSLTCWDSYNIEYHAIRHDKHSVS